MASTWVPRASRKESQRVSTCGGQNIWQNGHSNRSNAIVLLPKPTPRCWPSASCYAHFTTTKKCRNLLGVAIAPNFYLFSPNLSLLHTILTFLPDSGVQLFLHGQQTANDILLPGRKTNGLCEAVCVRASIQRITPHRTYVPIGRPHTYQCTGVCAATLPTKKKKNFFFFSLPFVRQVKAVTCPST